MADPNVKCLFCRIAAGEIPAKRAYEDEDVVAFHDVNPQAPTHVLVIPRRHIEKLDELEPQDALAMGKVLVRAGSLARELRIDSPGCRLVINNGEAAGQTIFHIHAHLLGGRRFGWPPG
ncbi:MAG TPA: histidine triad nucleotide-binding protein [Thermoanaerobaculia bacterium]|nr:histidine triad nucleotide-binding protein [Thermoanaerobaculia bacterium]